MSVIGIDFGNESCFVAVAKAGGIETIANDYSLRATPSCVAFAGKNRILGVAAKNQQVTNMKNTICGFKRFIGRKFDDPFVQSELQKTSNVVESRPDGGIGFRVHYLGQDHVFSPEQLTAMLFTKLKDTSAAAVQTQINDCVITVPFYYTNAERKALLDAAQIAGLNVLRLMNETTATALSYGFYRTDLPEENAKGRNVVFVDCGHSSIQVSVCAFNKSKLKMLAATCEQVGGRDFDEYLAEHFSKEFITKYKIDPRTNKRAYVRLLAEVEKLKKQMSANGTKLPLGIECFMNDIDVSSSMQRSDFEQLCSSLFARMEEGMKKCLKESKLTLDEIHSVEIVGGSSRIPAIKAMIEQVFGKAPSTTLNQDEAVSRGAALQCAIMSPAVRVREFGVTDIQNYSVKVLYDGESGPQGEMEVFPAYHAAPFSRMLSFFRRGPFSIKVCYSDAASLPYPDISIGSWEIKGIKANTANEASEVKIKVRINNNGIVLISSAQMVEKKEGITEEEENPAEPTSPEPMDVQEERNDESVQEEVSNGGWTQRVKGWFGSESGATKQDKKKKSSAKLVELMLEAYTHGLSPSELNLLIEEENKMITNDRQEKERIDARNALEEFVYDIRGRVHEGGDLFKYVSQVDRENLCVQLDEIENWLYDDGEDCERQIYKDRLAALQKITDPIKLRHAEYESHSSALEQLGHAVQLSRKAVDLYRNKDDRYSHLTETEMLNISEAADKAETFLNGARSKLSKNQPTEDPSIRTAEINHEYDLLSATYRSILSRPKPKAPTPPPSSTEHKNDETAPPKADQKESEMDVE